MAGYRSANGWSLSGRALKSDADLAIGSNSLTYLELFAGKRSMLGESEDWRTFWDVELGGGYADLACQR